MESASHPKSKKEDEPLSRPNPHIIITILLPLLQLITMHCLEIKSHWSKYRFPLSAASGLFAILHFHYVVWFSSIPYPLTTYAARIVETIMLSIIAVTVALNALTQLFTEGALIRPLFGHSAIMPRLDEDFNHALFRLGTASLDATAVAGFGNEVGGVSSARPRDIALAHYSNKREHVRGELEIDRAGVSSLSPAYEQRGTRRVTKKGLANEITSVKVKAASTDLWMNTVLNVAWQRHLITFLASAWRAVKRLWALGLLKARGVRGRERSPSVVLLDGPPSLHAHASSVGPDPYERFLRGEAVSDDEDDFLPENEERAAQRDTSDTSDAEEGEEGEGEGTGEADEAAEPSEQAQLYADLSSDMTPAPLLLAHMTDASSSPLTRGRYGRLVSGTRPRERRPAAPDDSDEWDEWVMERRHAKRSTVREEDLASENTYACVICTVEPRDIICWPCR